jgi:hypothetical protein
MLTIDLHLASPGLLLIQCFSLQVKENKQVKKTTTKKPLS